MFRSPFTYNKCHAKRNDRKGHSFSSVRRFKAFTAMPCVSGIKWLYTFKLLVGEPEPVHILLQVVYQRIRQRKAIIFESSFYIK